MREGPNFYFGQIYDVAVRADGRIFVADGRAHHVKVYAPDGSFRDSIGTLGEGPGEFRRPSEVVVARGDSLYVLDGYFGRVHVFGPDGTFAYAFMARGGGGSPRNMMVREDGFVFSYFPFSRAVAKEEARVAVRPVGTDGGIGDTVLTARAYQIAWKEDGPRMAFYSVPFSRSSHFAMGPEEKVHHAWSDSLRVRVYSLSGERPSIVAIPFQAIPVTDDEREAALGNRSGDARSLVEDQIPTTKPAFDHFLVDDEGRYWFGRPTAHPDTTAWWRADPATKRVVTSRLRSEIEFMTVLSGFAYGRSRTEDGAPVLVRYRVETEW